MIITKNEHFRKYSNLRLRPTKAESYNIQYLLKTKGLTLTSIGVSLGIKSETVLNVVAGRRRSARVEAEIARILGKASWEDVVIEARLAVSNPAYRPSQNDIDEYKNLLQEKAKQAAAKKAKQLEALSSMRQMVQLAKNGKRC